jgi:hypothetical protein
VLAVRGPRAGRRITRVSPDELIKEARRDGYVLKTNAKSGIYVFCKTDAKVGTRFITENRVDGALHKSNRQLSAHCVNGC